MDKWEPGDLALCVDDDWASLFPNIKEQIEYPKKGATYLVTEAVWDKLFKMDFLMLAGVSRGMWDAQMFVKNTNPPEEKKRTVPNDLEVA